MKQPRPDAQIFHSRRDKCKIRRKKEKSDPAEENGKGHRDHQGAEFAARPQDEWSHPEQQIDRHIEKRHHWNEGDRKFCRKMNRDPKAAPRGQKIHSAVNEHEPERVQERQLHSVTKMRPTWPSQERLGTLRRSGPCDVYNCLERRHCNSSPKY